MAAEKLTKQRLIQILTMLALLIAAFVWRTIDHYQQQNQCLEGADCEVTFSDSAVKLVWDPTRKTFVLVHDLGVGYRVTTVAGSASIRNQPGRTEVKLQDSSVDVEIYNIINNQKRVITLKSKN
jgi:hypothetical protein